MQAARRASLVVVLLLLAPVVLVLLAFAAPALGQPEVELARRWLGERAPRWRCDPARAVHCSAEGCKQIELRNG